MTSFTHFSREDTEVQGAAMTSSPSHRSKQEAWDSDSSELNPCLLQERGLDME